MDDSFININQNRDRNSSPVPEFNVDELRAYHSLENLLTEIEEPNKNSPWKIIPPTPFNDSLSLSPAISYILNGNNLLKNMEQIHTNDEGDNSRESSFFDSDADPEYVPPASDEAMVDLLPEDEPCCSKTLTSKRIKCTKNWKSNIRKAKCQRGEEFTDNFGITRREREIKMGCGGNCPYGCHEEFSLSERKFIFDHFWHLNSKSKGEYFGNLVFKLPVERKRTANTNSRRRNTFIYNFLKDGRLKQVCQVFFTQTLDINKTRIHYYFNHLVDANTTTSKSPAKGRHIKRAIPQNKLDEIVGHISEFPTMDSHYCRSSSNKKYLEPHLSLKKMYEMYCIEIDDPVKFWAYKNVFETQFNLGFFIPKKDLCNKCEQHKMKDINGKTVSEAEETEFSNHIANKLLAKSEKDVDKTNTEPTTRILVVDLQNVFALPKANVNCFYYKRKFLCYNLTGYCKDNGTTYCSIWNESMQGRGGNELASAFVKILLALMSDFPLTERIIIWTDSCVPQNRNSIVSLSFVKFMKEHPQVKTIEQKYAEPGHSLLQEVDAVHSTLEKYLKNLEIFSPISLMRLLSKAKFPKVKLKLLQMQHSDFINYSQVVHNFNFSCIPYSKVRQLKYESRNLMNVSFKRSFNDNYTTESIAKVASARRTKKKREEVPTDLFATLPLGNEKNKISEEKRKDLMSLLNFMPEVDQNFYNAVLKTE